MCSTTRKTVDMARQLRRALSPTEVILWSMLRERPGGFKFRRQHPVGPHSADFYCARAKLVIEVDGDAHDMGDRPARDAERDIWFESRGYQVMRIPAGEIHRDRSAVIEGIVAACRL